MINKTAFADSTRRFLYGPSEAQCYFPDAMAWRSGGSTNASLIDNLVSNRLLSSPALAAAFKTVDRAHYAPTDPYADSPQPIGYRATISAPHMHANAAEALLPYLKPGKRVLDIGSGSGYLTRVFAEMVKPTGKVVGVDHISELVEMSIQNTRKSPAGSALLDSGVLRFLQADGRIGLEDEGPWDAIHVGAAAKELHEELVEQLARPGRLFVPVEEAGGGQWVWVVEKDEAGMVTRRREYGVRYVPLTDHPGGRG